MADKEKKTKIDVKQNNGKENSANMATMKMKKEKSIDTCENKKTCITLRTVVNAFNSAISEEQAWAVMYQLIKIYKDRITGERQQAAGSRFKDVYVPSELDNVNLHKDGSVHVNMENTDKNKCRVTSQRKQMNPMSSFPHAGVKHSMHPTADSKAYYPPASHGHESYQYDAPHIIEKPSKALGLKDLFDIALTTLAFLSFGLFILQVLMCITLKRPATSAGMMLIPSEGGEETEMAGRRAKRAINQFDDDILTRLGVIIYAALDFNVSEDEEPLISDDLVAVIKLMTAEDNDDEGIERDSEDLDEEKYNECETKELDNVLQICTSRLAPVSPSCHQARSTPDDHYRAVCRALAAESFELQVFLEKVSKRDIGTLQLQGGINTSRKELEKLSFNEWARFWMQVVDELRRGFQLKKISFTRTPIEYELTPYEMLMEDIRSRRYQLRKVMVNGDVPPKVKKDAHLVILEFIRSRPPLKKATDRKLPPPRRNLEPREKLLDQIRQGRVLKPVVTKLKNRLLASNNHLDDVKKTVVDDSNDQQLARSKSPRNTLRLIPVDLSLLQEDDFEAETAVDTSSQEPYSICFSKEEKVLNQENNQNNLNTVVRRQALDRQTSSHRRHTIVGCHKSFNLSAPFTSMPAHCSSSTAVEEASLEESSITTTTTTTTSRADEDVPSDASSGPSSLNIDVDEPIEATPDWRNSLNLTDKLSLTLEEIIHIRSVMTKAELESLPVGVKVKEEVERRKLCFLCLRTRFSLFGQRGVNCKLCDRTVCIKCFSKMRIPRDQFRNVPVVLLSPSLLSTPVPSPIHHAAHVNMEESFSRTLMERLLRPDLERKSRSSVGSAPSSPKNQRSLSGTPHLEQVVGKVNVNNNSIMSRSMEGPRNVLQSPGRPHSNNSTLDRRHRFFALSSQTLDPKETLRGEIMVVCNDCKALVLEIMKASRQTRSSARNIAIKNLTLDLSPVYRS